MLVALHGYVSALPNALDPRASGASRPNAVVAQLGGAPSWHPCAARAAHCERRPAGWRFTALPGEGLVLSGAVPCGRRLACHAARFVAGVAATATAQLGRRWLDAVPYGLQLFSAALPMRSALPSAHRGTRARRVLHFVDVA